MKLDEINALGLSHRTRREIEVDLTELIVSDEFGKSDRETDYRRRAIERLVKLGEQGHGFHSDPNIIWDMASRFVRLSCPYCGQDMKGGASGGAGMVYSLDYKCGCGASGGFQMHAEALWFAPPPRSTNDK